MLIYVKSPPLYFKILRVRRGWVHLYEDPPGSSFRKVVIYKRSRYYRIYKNYKFESCISARPHRQRERLWVESCNQSDFKALGILARWSENLAILFWSNVAPIKTLKHYGYSHNC
jgi:hypothetical protein